MRTLLAPRNRFWRWLHGSGWAHQVLRGKPHVLLREAFCYPRQVSAWLMITGCSRQRRKDNPLAILMARAFAATATSLVSCVPVAYHVRACYAMRIWLRCFVLLLVVASGDLGLLEGKTANVCLLGAGPSSGARPEASLEPEFSRSREALRASPEFEGDDADSHFRRAQVLHHRGDLTGAAEEFQQAIRLNPEFAEAYRGLGVVLMDRHDWPGAVEALQVTVRLHEDDAEAFYWLGRALMAQGDWTGATGALGTAIRLDPANAEPYMDLGLVRMVQADLTGAEEALRVAIQLNPMNADAHHLLDILRKFRDDPEQVVQAACRILEMRFARE